MSEKQSKKKKSKKAQKKGKRNVLNYKLFSTIGAVFHGIVYLLIDHTFYNYQLLWGSIIVCGLVSGIYIIAKTGLHKTSSYQKIKGVKLHLSIFLICTLLLMGATLLMGNVINGTLLGLNYLGKGRDSNSVTYKIDKIEKSRKGVRRFVRRRVPTVYIEKDGELIAHDLPERYSSSKNYEDYKTIQMNVRKGFLGFEIIETYQLIE